MNRYFDLIVILAGIVITSSLTSIYFAKEEASIVDHMTRCKAQTHYSPPLHGPSYREDGGVVYCKSSTNSWQKLRRQNYE